MTPAGQKKWLNHAPVRQLSRPPCPGDRLALGVMAPAIFGHWWGDVELLGAGLVVALACCIVLFVVRKPRVAQSALSNA